MKRGAQLLVPGPAGVEVRFVREIMFWHFCHLQPVTFLYKKNPTTKIGRSGGASRWRVCYQWGLPCLVLFVFKIYIVIAKMFAIMAKPSAASFPWPPAPPAWPPCSPQSVLPDQLDTSGDDDDCW